MVTLSRITTKTGDAGQTSLGNGERVPKTALRIQACGGVDELNSLIGVILQADLSAETRDFLRRIQNDLFDVGADLCMPESTEPASISPLRVTARHIEPLETAITAGTSQLPALKSFVLPGGSPAAAQLHLARAVCRRVEISVVALHETEPLNPLVLVYLNRLSDLLFVQARLANEMGRSDVLWVPGGSSPT